MAAAWAIAGGEHGSATIGVDEIRLRAGPRTDWFTKPDGSGTSANVVTAEILNEAPLFSLTARVSVGFAATYDAGALFLALDEENWAKLAFEQSAQAEPTVVSVVTREVSDDADGPTIAGDTVWLRLYSDGRIVAFHDSLDGERWRFRRLFTLPGVSRRPIRIGFGAQSPTGTGVEAVFRDIDLRYQTIENLRDGS